MVAGREKRGILRIWAEMNVSWHNGWMAYDAELADRLFESAGSEPGVTTRKMFGGFAVMVNGNMLAGVMGNDLMVRVGPDNYEELLEEPGATPMEFTGRPMKGMLTVDGAVVDSDCALETWVERCRSFVGTLPPK
jgi:TfoX/Sxy family transcriptional regulator of competence genes